MKLLNDTVYPSNKKTIWVEKDDKYGGAHHYRFLNCYGFNNGKTEYAKSIQDIQFVKKESDDSITEGLQSEQLILALLDRHQKLDKQFPCPENKEMIQALESFLDASKRRVANRIDRNVMGNLKK